jgi:hypothetical protein
MAGSKKPVKRTVAIHPIMDAYVRETWSLLVKDVDGFDITYSAALNFMLLGAVNEALKKRGWTKETREWAWAFARDRETIEQLKLYEALPQFRQCIEEEEHEG